MKSNISSSVQTDNVPERVFQVVSEESEQPRGAIDRSSVLGHELFDSLGTVELIMALEDEFEISIPDAEAEKIHTVGELIDAIEARLAAPPREAAPDVGRGAPSRP